MSLNAVPHHLPDYDAFVHSIHVLALPISASHVHGVMCGYLAAGAILEGEAYVHSLAIKTTDEHTRAATLALFSIYAISQQQLNHLGFDFQLLLPDEDEPLALRAQAFSEWCAGFTQGITLANVDFHQLQDEDAQDALAHLDEFAELDYHSLEVNDEDEDALMEVCEYARMAVLHIHSDLHAQKNTTERASHKTAH